MSDYTARSDTSTDRQMIHDDTWYMMIHVRLPKKNIKRRKLWEDGRVVLLGTATDIPRPGFFEPHLIGTAIVFKGQQGVENRRNRNDMNLIQLIRWRLDMIRVGLKRLVCGSFGWSLIFGHLWSIWWFWSAFYAFCGTLMQGHHGGRSFWQSNSQLLWLEAKLFAMCGMCGLNSLVFRSCRIFRPLMFWPGSYHMLLNCYCSLFAFSGKLLQSFAGGPQSQPKSFQRSRSCDFFSKRHQHFTNAARRWTTRPTKVSTQSTEGRVFARLPVQWRCIGCADGDVGQSLCACFEMFWWCTACVTKSC